MEKELQHLKKVFVEYNNYPIKLIENIIENETKERRNQQQSDEMIVNSQEETETVTLYLPYAGNKGEQILKKMKKRIEKYSKKTKIHIVYTAKKLGSKFPVKDKTKIKHMHNVVYHVKYPNKKCKSEYTGQTKCRVKKRTIQHNKTDKKSHVLKHSKKTKHRRVWINDVKVIGKGYKSNFKRKISESLFIKKLKPDLNVQKDAYKLTLFN